MNPEVTAYYKELIQIYEAARQGLKDAINAPVYKNFDVNDAEIELAKAGIELAKALGDNPLVCGGVLYYPEGGRIKEFRDIPIL